jgi:DNA gyrase subunit A
VGENDGEIDQAYSTGKGIITLRGKAEIEEAGNRHVIRISEIPYQVNKTTLIERIAELASTLQDHPQLKEHR